MKMLKISWKYNKIKNIVCECNLNMNFYGFIMLIKQFY